MKKKVLALVGKGVIGIATVAVLNVLFMLFLIGIFKIPMNEAMKTNMGNSLTYWRNDGNADFPLFGDYGYEISDDMDMLWTNSATICSGDPFMDMVRMGYVFDENAEPRSGWNDLVKAIYDPANGQLADYSRYWNIHVGWLKLLYRYFDIGQIRYLLFMIIAVMFAALEIIFYEKQGIKAALPLAVGTFFSALILHSVCVTYFGDIFNGFLGALVIALCYNKKWFSKWEYLWYIIIGALTFAGTSLIAPLVSLGMCLLTDVLLKQKDDKDRKHWISMCVNTICWIGGYMLTLLWKQGLSKKYLGFQTGTDTIWQWIGPEMGLGERIATVGKNFARTFSPLHFKLPLFILIVVGICICMIKAHKKSTNVLQLLFVSIYPIVWILIIARHSLHWFVATIISIFMIGVLAALMSFIDFDKLKRKSESKNKAE